MCMSSPSVPKAPDPPPPVKPPPPAPAQVDAAVKDARMAQKRRTALVQGYNANIKTGPRGLLGQGATTGDNSLLGGGATGMK